MATIDLIVLGMLKKEPLSAYDLQKLVEYRNISKWVKISTPSIYKKVTYPGHRLHDRRGQERLRAWPAVHHVAQSGHPGPAALRRQ